MRLQLAVVLALLFIIPSISQSSEFLRYAGFDVGQSLSGYTSQQEEIKNIASPLPIPPDNPPIIPYCPPPVPVYAPPNHEAPSPITMNKPSLIKIKHHCAHVNMYTGYRMGDYAAMEGGVFTSRSFNDPRRAETEGKAHAHGLHMGWVFIIPVLSKVEAIGGLGVSFAWVHIYRPNSINLKQEGVVPRLMLGAQYDISNRFKLRGSIVWHNMNGICRNKLSVKNVVNIGVGVNYSFEST